jgi:hypothetical protein
MEIRRWIIVVALFLIATLNGFAQSAEPYFCTRENSVLKYIRKDTKGAVKWYHTMSIGTQDGDTLDYTSFIENHKRKPYYGDTPAQLDAIIREGEVTLNVAESVAAVFRTIFPKNTKITTTGGESALPCDMAPGDTLPDVYASVKALGMKMKIEVTDRRVLRYETISTPAGDFDCIVVRETKLEKGMGRNRHTTADTWYARGVGMVRHDTHDTDMNLLTCEILTEFYTDK